MKRTAVILAILLLASTVKAATLGYTTVGTAGNQSMDSDSTEAVGPFTTTTGGVTSIASVYTNTAGKLFKIGIYTGSGTYPSDLLASSGGVYSEDHALANVSITYTLVAGTNYWLGILVDNGSFSYPYDYASYVYRTGQTYESGFPNPFPSSISNSGETPCLYVTYTPTVSTNYVPAIMQAFDDDNH